MQEYGKSVIVTNPDTGTTINVTEIIDSLLYYYKNSKEDFDKQINILNDCISYSDTLEKQVGHLRNMAYNLTNYEGVAQLFKDQLDKVSMYGLMKKEKYVPISAKYGSQYLSHKNEKGISFLCPDIDRLTGGIMPGTVCTIAGASGSMKTTTAVNICFQALKDNKNVCYLSLEETPMNIYSKLLSRASVDLNKNLEHQEITQHKLSSEEQELLLNEVKPYVESLPGKFHVLGEVDLPNYERTSIENRLKEVEQQIKNSSEDGRGIDLLVVDHIQLLKYAVGASDEYKLLNIYVNFFRKMALSFLNQGKEIAVILLSQVNREGMAYAQKHNGMYLMQHLGEASEIERCSSYIITTYTDATSQITKLLKVGCIKLRGAQLPKDTINVFADGAFYQVGDTAIPQQQDYSNATIFGDDTSTDSTIPTMEYDLEAALKGMGL